MSNKHRVLIPLTQMMITDYRYRYQSADPNLSNSLLSFFSIEALEKVARLKKEGDRNVCLEKSKVVLREALERQPIFDTSAFELMYTSTVGRGFLIICVLDTKCREFQILKLKCPNLVQKLYGHIAIGVV